MKRDNLVNKEDRINWIDLARSLAICCVILVHVIELTNSLNTEYMKNVVLGIRIYTFALYTIGRVGVLLFLFLSGYLLLDRNYEKGSCVRFWKRNVSAKYSSGFPTPLFSFIIVVERYLCILRMNRSLLTDK